MELDRGIEVFCSLCLGGGKYRIEFPNKESGFVTSLRAARVSTSCSESDTDWVFIDGDVEKLLEVVYW